MSNGWTPRRVAILGASGLTGSGLAHQLSLTDRYDEIRMFDVKTNLLEAHLIDMREAQIVAGRTRAVLTAGSLEDEASHGAVDLVVVAASLPETPDGSREAFLAGNLGVLRALVPAIARLAGDSGVVMILTNPADVLATCLASETEIEPDRIFGYCLNDSIRFTAAVARELSVSPERVDALVIGEHGDGQVPVWSRIRVDGDLVALSTEQRERIDADARGWFRRWSDLRPGRSSGWTTPLGSARTIRDLHEGIPVPVAVWRPSEGAHVTLLATVEDNRVAPTPLSYADADEVAATAEAGVQIANKARRALSEAAAV